MARCQSCGNEPGKNEEGYDNQFCEKCALALVDGKTSVIAKRYLKCGHMVGHEDESCKWCRRALKGMTIPTYTPGVQGTTVILDEEIYRIDSVNEPEVGE